MYTLNSPQHVHIQTVPIVGNTLTMPSGCVAGVLCCSCFFPLHSPRVVAELVVAASPTGRPPHSVSLVFRNSSACGILRCRPLGIAVEMRRLFICGCAIAGPRQLVRAGTPASCPSLRQQNVPWECQQPCPLHIIGVGIGVFGWGWGSLHSSPNQETTPSSKSNAWARQQCLPAVSTKCERGSRLVGAPRVWPPQWNHLLEPGRGCL